MNTARCETFRLSVDSVAGGVTEMFRIEPFNK